MLGVNPLVTFCARFHALITLVTSAALLALTALFEADVMESNFFLNVSMATLRFHTLYSTAALVLGSVLSMTHTVPSSNLCVGVLAVMSVNSGLLIKGTIDYSGSLPGDFNNWLIAWLALYFGNFILLVFLTLFATVRQSKAAIASRNTKCKSCIYSNIEPVSPRSYELTARTMPRANTVRSNIIQHGGGHHGGGSVQGTIRGSAPAYNDGYNSDDYTTYM